MSDFLPPLLGLGRPEVGWPSLPSRAETDRERGNRIRRKQEKPAISEAEAETPATQAADIPVTEEPKESKRPKPPREPRSYKGLVWVVIIILLGAGGFFAWQQGLVEQAGDTMKQAGGKVIDLVEAQLPDEVETAPITDTQPGIQDGEKDPGQTEVVEPSPEPQPEPDRRENF